MMATAAENKTKAFFLPRRSVLSPFLLRSLPRQKRPSSREERSLSFLLRSLSLEDALRNSQIQHGEYLELLNDINVVSYLAAHVLHVVH